MTRPNVTRRCAFLRLAVGCVLGAALLLMLAAVAGAAAGVDVSAVEGQSFTGNVVSGLSCPLANATITWGDGISTPGASDAGTGIQGTHTYTEDGTYSGSVSYTYMPTLRTCPTGPQTASFQATVQDAPLTGAGINVSGTAGQSLTAVVAHIADTNPNASASDFSAQITWGDGTSSAGIVSNTTSGGFDVTGTHTYATGGTYPITTNITDTGGSSGSASSTAHIDGAPPPPPPPPPTVTPDTIIVTGPVGVTSDLEPRFIFTSTVAGSTFQCTLDPGLHGAKWTACASPHFTAKLDAGNHLFWVRATSPAGVTDPTPAQRAFQIQPAASTEEHTCVKAGWDPPSLGGALFGGQGVMTCLIQFSCPQWYDCVLSGGLTFSFTFAPFHEAYRELPTDVVGSLDVFDNTVTNDFKEHKDSGFCVADGQQYPQSGDTFYCSRTGQLAIHGQSDQPLFRFHPTVLCLAFTFVGVVPENWFDSEFMGCTASIRRTWAPGVAHAHPLIHLVRRDTTVFAGPHAAIWTGVTASCPARGGVCPAAVTATLVTKIRGARTSAVSAPLARKPPQPAALPQLIGGASLKLRAGKQAKITFSLTRQGAASLRKRHRLRIHLAIAVPPSHLKGRDTMIRRTIVVVDHH